jgi:hypothetical protein
MNRSSTAGGAGYTVLYTDPTAYVVTILMIKIDSILVHHRYGIIDDIKPITAKTAVIMDM